ncbi:MAG: hypothetical protein AAGD43_34195 [Pseudomonadota bacterium]
MLKDRCIRHTTCRLLFAALVLCAFGVTPSTAGNLNGDASAGSSTKLPRQVSAVRPEVLNLLADRKSAPVEKIGALQIGNGSYLCTPAGFGQRSWCRRN